MSTPSNQDSIRLDKLMVELGLVSSREKAQALISSGLVTVNGEKARSSDQRVRRGTKVIVKESLPYVSRGGYKLAYALDRFQIDVKDKVALDAGASTGGFTDVLLQRGAKKVYAVDVGYGQLDVKLRNDPRVVNLERTNIRFLDSLPELVDIVTADLSFISLVLVIPKLVSLSKEHADYLLLVKPQFEAGRHQVKKGVVKDPKVHNEVLHRIVESAKSEGLSLKGIVPSPILGPAGNVEFIAWFNRLHELDSTNIPMMIEAAISESEKIKTSKEHVSD